MARKIVHFNMGVPRLKAGRAFRGSAVAPFSLRENGFAAPPIPNACNYSVKELFFMIQII